jgi:hypothetical protein
LIAFPTNLSFNLFIFHFFYLKTSLAEQARIDRVQKRMFQEVYRRFFGTQLQLHPQALPLDFTPDYMHTRRSAATIRAVRAEPRFCKRKKEKKEKTLANMCSL